MILTKDELIKSLQDEVRVLLHLISKVEPAMLDYRPTPGQRSVLELLRYLTIMPPIHLRGAVAGSWSMETWGKLWDHAEAEALQLDLDGLKAAIAGHSAIIAEVLTPCSDDHLRGHLEMFGAKATRGSWLVSLVLCHYAAYRMQLFLYLKSCGREDLNTFNLWVGMDRP